MAATMRQSQVHGSRVGCNRGNLHNEAQVASMESDSWSPRTPSSKIT